MLQFAGRTLWLNETNSKICTNFCKSKVRTSIICDHRLRGTASALRIGLLGASGAAKASGGPPLVCAAALSYALSFGARRRAPQWPHALTCEHTEEYKSPCWTEVIARSTTTGTHSFYSKASREPQNSHQLFLILPPSLDHITWLHSSARRPRGCGSCRTRSG